MQPHLPDAYAKYLFAKLSSLSEDKARYVEKFIDSLEHIENEDDAIRKHFLALANESFAAIWDNEFDAQYDNL